MKPIDVSCAVIHKSGKILIAQRKPDDHLGGFWEFPGGKFLDCETLEGCLVREVMEELGVEVLPEKLLFEVIHTYPHRAIKLHFYLCKWMSGEPQKIDCQDFRWIKPEQLVDFQFPPADTDVIAKLIAGQEKYFPK